VAVLIVERFILARLRNRRFLSLGELNEAIQDVLGDLNARLMRRVGASRREFFETIVRVALGSTGGSVPPSSLQHPAVRPALQLRPQRHKPG